MGAARFNDLAAAARGALAASDGDRGAVARNLEAASQLGLGGLTVPVADGGLGANLLDFAAYQQEVARADGATALVLAMHHMLLGGEAEGGAWPADAWAQVCAAAVAGGGWINSAATEPGAGTPSQGGLPSTAAARDGEGWRLNGRKTYTTGAPYLRFARVSARVEPDGERAYGARFLVRLPSPGATIEDAWRPAALAAAANDDLVLEGAPAAFLYAEEGRGCEGTVWFIVAVAATYLGIGFSAYEQVLEFTRGRVTAAGPVADREPVRLRLGRARAGLDVARRNLLETCSEWIGLSPGDRQRLLPDFGLAKVTAVSAATAAADTAVQVAGAAGLGAGQPFARLLLEARAGQNHPPIEDVAHMGLAARDLD